MGLMGDGEEGVPAARAGEPDADVSAEAAAPARDSPADVVTATTNTFLASGSGGTAAPSPSPDGPATSPDRPAASSSSSSPPLSPPPGSPGAATATVAAAAAATANEPASSSVSAIASPSPTPSPAAGADQRQGQAWSKRRLNSFTSMGSLEAEDDPATLRLMLRRWWRQIGWAGCCCCLGLLLLTPPLDNMPNPATTEATQSQEEIQRRFLRLEKEHRTTLESLDTKQEEWFESMTQLRKHIGRLQAEKDEAVQRQQQRTLFGRRVGLVGTRLPTAYRKPHPHLLASVASYGFGLTRFVFCRT